MNNNRFWAVVPPVKLLVLQTSLGEFDTLTAYI